MEIKSRKLDPSRLYKLTKLTVIVVSLVSGILGTNQVYNVLYGASEIRHIDEVCPPGSFEDCVYYFMRGRQEVEANGWRNLGVAVLLPTLFFGGTTLYKYLFSEQKNPTSIK